METTLEESLRDLAAESTAVPENDTIQNSVALCDGDSRVSLPAADSSSGVPEPVFPPMTASENSAACTSDAPELLSEHCDTMSLGGPVASVTPAPRTGEVLEVTAGSGMLVSPYVGFEEHVLSEGCPFYVGHLPDEMIWDTTTFENVWNMHPAERARIVVAGKECVTPRWVQAYGVDYRFSGRVHRALPIPSLFQPLLAWVHEHVDERLNGMLVNWYEGPDHRIDFHHDNNRDMVRGAPIVNVSFGETRGFRLIKDAEKYDFPARDGTVFITPFETDLIWKHGVPKSKKYEGRRISLTFRAFTNPVLTQEEGKSADTFAEVETPVSGTAVKCPPGSRRVQDIRIGNRYRKDLGDINTLAASIGAIGLLHPIVVNDKDELIAGLRCLEACKQLGWEQIPVTIIDNLDDALRMLEAQRDENTCRKDYTVSEAVALGKAIETIEKERAKERQRAHGGTAPGRPANTGGKLPQVSGKGKTRDKVAKAIDLSPRSYDKAKAVVEAAEANPELFKPIQDEMDRTGRVEPAHRKLLSLQDEAQAKQVASSNNGEPPDSASAGAVSDILYAFNNVHNIVSRKVECLAMIATGLAEDQTNALRKKLEQIAASASQGLTILEQRGEEEQRGQE